MDFAPTERYFLWLAATENTAFTVVGLQRYTNRFKAEPCVR